MAITDLTNTKWKFNDSITATSGYGRFELQTNKASWTDVVIGYTYNIANVSFTATANSVVLGRDLGSESLQEVFFQNTTDWINFTSSIEGQTIEIIGGTDATNTNLISWLEQNATQVKDPILQLAPFLTSIANAIRAKKGTTAQINAQNFASEIESIESGGAGATQYILKTYLNTNGLIGATINGVYYPVNNEFSYDPYAGVKCIGFVYDGWFGTISKCTNLYNLTKGAVATTSNLSRKDILILTGDAELYGEF